MDEATRKIRDLLMKVRVLIVEDIEELEPDETARHQAWLWDCDTFLKDTARSGPDETRGPTS